MEIRPTPFDQVIPIKVTDTSFREIMRLRPDGVMEFPTDQPDEAARLFVDDVYRMWREVLPAPELRLADALTKAQDALRAVEWNGYAFIGLRPCPCCGNERDQGHASACAIAAALGGGA